MSDKLRLWQENWGRTYDRDFKKRVLGDLLEGMSLEGKIGEVILDVGSGKEPVSRLIPNPKKVITVDLGGPLVASANHLHLQCDFEELSRGIKPVSTTATEEIVKFLGRDPQEINQSPWADTIIMADILNYVSCKTALSSGSKLLRPGGRLLVFNKPDRGYRDFFSEEGVKSNCGLFQEIERNQLETEYRDFPWELPGEEGFRDNALLVLVARKMLADSSG